ncbi:hypothetical protein IJ596_07820 [bacterium]|nr:hypothetical protein [bacterium]
MKFNKLMLVSLLCMVVAIVLLLISYPGETLKKETPNKSVTKQVAHKAEKKYMPDTNYEYTSVTVNFPIPLSYKTKKEIYELRKRYVKESIFSSKDYKPSDSVFGMIEDNKPWISTNICAKESGETYVDGASEESRFIANPTALVALEYPFNWDGRQDSSFYENPINQLIPLKISYSKSKNEIEVAYSRFPFESKAPYFYEFNGVNAADLGYRYAYLDLGRSTCKPKFDEKDNISNSVIEFQNFIHLGSSCGVAGGCNNGSPRQTYLEFHVEEYSPCELYIKLWNSRPNSYRDKADINEKIIVGKH